MKAVFRTAYGSADILELREIDRPVPGDDQALIKVCAASVNPLDWHELRGKPFLVRLMGFGLVKPKRPVLGVDMAGRVEAIGRNVTRLSVGDEVFGPGTGAFAEYACIRENVAVAKPAAITFEQAAAVPIAGVTALQALRDQGRLQQGQHVLINGASGGVGTFAVQIAKVLGAHVTGVCSGRNTAMVRSIGADHVIDYTTTDYWAGGDRYDVIVDNAAFYSVRKPLSALKLGGIYVPIGGSSSTASVLGSMVFDPLIAKIAGKKLGFFIAGMKRPDLDVMSDLLESGKVVPVIGRNYTLEDTPQAIRYVEEGHARGKVVIQVR